MIENPWPSPGFIVDGAVDLIGFDEIIEVSANGDPGKPHRLGDAFAGVLIRQMLPQIVPDIHSG